MIIEGRIKPDYHRHNFCTVCQIVYSKKEKVCSVCKHKLRTVPRSGLRNKKYQEMKSRI